MWFPNVEDVRRIHFELVDVFEKSEDPISPPGVKSEGLLESACQRPHTGIGGVDKYKTLTEKTAALFHSLIKNHAFHNGNKRTALVAMLTSLHRNDKVLCRNVDDDLLYNFTLDVTADNFPDSNARNVDQIVIEISQWLSQNTEALDNRFGTTSANDFIKMSELAGARVKKTDGGRSFSINTDVGGVKFSKKTRTFAGPVVRNYLKKLGLTQVKSGLSAGEFKQGFMDEREEIYRYMAALQRLAKT
ncbi:type II toxin-antitoxin system death-on-curing family toxin [Brevundimonas sp. PAMC22021]|uniref:type II toxin-antitoxin system death-on-curing family toxin n=1 Tax=Brevundimonas sp. PAMC22021 TaxID=2861285 RepID=UPI001C6366A5|nr:type II toxin-antitoxin system death-on-curing family toxin [Brevundimonas sp. PAMC22021]QYF86340.1 type II toxin-antitoxin system death-on-curing family toxin [Brevundimonas sp. PAMC22021]